MKQRDWQKDMELCEAATPGRWGWYEPTRCIYTARKDRDALDTILYDPAGAGHLQEEDAEFISEAREALPYWLQEVKRLEGIAKGRGREMLRKNVEINELEARVDASEKRLKEMADILIEEAKLAEERGAEMHAREIRAMVVTLYPDYVQQIITQLRSEIYVIRKQY